MECKQLLLEIGLLYFLEFKKLIKGNRDLPIALKTQLLTRPQRTRITILPSNVWT